MNLLVIDTSTDRAALAVACRDGRRSLSAADAAGGRHGRDLLPAIAELLTGVRLAPRQIDGVAVGLGPGSFTGLRVGLTAAKVLAYAAGAPLVGLDSLEAIARNAPPEALRVAVAADAQRGELFAADFFRDAAGGPLLRSGPTRVVAEAEWRASLAPGTLVLGPAAARRLDPAPPGVAAGGPETARPDPARLLELALEVWASGRRDDPWFLEPVYLRRSAAEDQWDALGRP